MKARYRRLYENSLIIAPPLRQEELLSYRRIYPSAKFKLMSRVSFLERGHYQCDERAIIFLLKKGFSLAGAREIVRAFGRFQPGKVYKSEKLNALSPIFDELLEARMLYHDFYPDGDIKGRHIVLSGYRDATLIGKSLEGVPNLDTSFDIPSIEPRADYIEVTGCRDIVDECHEVAYRIAELLSKGVNPNDIYLANYSAKYYFTLSLFASYYGFSINFPGETSYFASPLGRTFLDMLRKGTEIDATLSEIRDSQFFDKDFDSFYLLVKTYQIEGFDRDKQIAVYEDLLKGETMSVPTFDPAVRILSEYYAPANSHVFFLDFSLGNSPKKAQNPCYFSEKDIEELGFFSLSEQFEQDKNELLALLKDPHLEMVSFHMKDFSSAVYPSPLVSEFSLKIVEPKKKEVEYSSLYCDLFGQAKKDKMDKYGIMDDELGRYFNPTIVPYDNAFRFLKGDAAYNPGSHSYSSLDSFYNCPFAYFVSNVLSFPRSPSSFSARVGTIFHSVLYDKFRQRKEGEGEFLFDASFEKAVRNSEENPREGVALSATEKVLLLSLREDCRKIVDYIETKEKLIENPARLCEFRIDTNVDGVPLHGTIDKALFFGGQKGDTRPYVSVIDYKTYAKDFKEEGLVHGLNMQLPIYAILLENDERFSPTSLAGVYFSPIILSNKARAAKNIEDYGSDLRLKGIFLDNQDTMSAFGLNFESDDYVAGTRKKKDGGYYSPGKAKSEDDFAAIKKKAKERIAFADRKIRNMDFPIAPAMKKDMANACEYCSYRPFCFRREKDIRYLDQDPFATFVEDDIDA